MSESNVAIVFPMPESWWPRVWEWMEQTPAANYEDGSPRDCDAFVEMKRAAVSGGERAVGIVLDGEPVGYIGFASPSRHVVAIGSMVVDAKVTGRGVGPTALWKLGKLFFASGVEKVQATFFADNERMHKMTRAIGCEVEGVLKRQVMRDGKAVDVVVVAFFKPDGADGR